MSTLLPYMEEALNSASLGPEDDNLRHGVVIILGTLAQHLDPSDEKVVDISTKLVSTISTSSEEVLPLCFVIYATSDGEFVCVSPCARKRFTYFKHDVSLYIVLLVEYHKIVPCQ